MAKNMQRVLIVCVAIVVLVVAVFSFWTKGPEEIEPVELMITPEAGNTDIEYSQYQEMYKDVPDATQDISVPLDNGTGTPATLIANSSGMQIEVNVPKKAWYALALEYVISSDMLFDYDLSIKINGKTPYSELNDVPIRAQWEIAENGYEDGMPPKLKTYKERIIQSIYDRSAYVQQPLEVCLEQGKNTILLTTETYDIELYGLRLNAPEKPLSYEEYKKTLSNQSGEDIYFQAEYPAYRNTSTILELVDSTSPDSVPVSPDRSTINTIGGDTFATPQNKVTWAFNVEKAGTYTLNLRVRQDYANGATVYRALYIDDKLPFEECKSLAITHKSGFRQWQPGDENGAYCFELEEGPHTLTLEVVLGDNGALLNEVEKIMRNLSSIYRRIIVLTSPDPDPYRDYAVATKLPDVVKDMDAQAKSLKNVVDYLIYRNGGRAGDVVELESMQRQLEKLAKEPESIPGALTSISENISAIGTWLSDKKDQPLEIDWIEWVPVAQKPRGSKTSAFRKIKFTVDQFITAYADDYIYANNDKEAIDVWTSVGREQYMILSNLIKQKFTPETGIKVNFKLVQGSLMFAIVSGIGPDATIFGSDCINYAVRKAVYPLNEFDGFEDITKEFHESAFVPLTLEGKVYALPESQIFPMMFYRKDIFEEKGYEVPQTWDDAYQLMFELQKNNMEFGAPSGLGGYLIFLYQRGGQLYSDEADACLLDTEKNVSAYRDWVKYFTDFSVPLSYNFLNRFRSGEMPIALSDYQISHSLMVFAPEIYGEWEMVPIPGTMQEDGSIDRSVTISTTQAMIFSGSDKKESSWEFLRWWVGHETQLAYANELENKVGIDARYTPANLLTFDNMMWTPQQRSVLTEQRKWWKAIPEIPGSYFTSRHFDNAFRHIVYDSADIKEVLSEYTELINDEITTKREELNLGKGAVDE